MRPSLIMSKGLCGLVAVGEGVKAFANEAAKALALI